MMLKQVNETAKNCHAKCCTLPQDVNLKIWIWRRTRRAHLLVEVKMGVFVAVGEWTLRVKTSDVHNAGSRAQVHATVYGTEGTSALLPLGEAGGDDFLQGREAEFKVDSGFLPFLRWFEHNLVCCGPCVRRPCSTYLSLLAGLGGRHRAHNQVAAAAGRLRRLPVAARGPGRDDGRAHRRDAALLLRRVARGRRGGRESDARVRAAQAQPAVRPLHARSVDGVTWSDCEAHVTWRSVLTNLSPWGDTESTDQPKARGISPILLFSRSFDELIVGSELKQSSSWDKGTLNGCYVPDFTILAGRSGLKLLLFSVLRYQVAVFTSNIAKGGTTAQVSITLFGKYGDTGRRPLRDSRTHDEPFGKGQVDVFEVEAVRLGDLLKLELSHDGTDPGSGSVSQTCFSLWSNSSERVFFR